MDESHRPGQICLLPLLPRPFGQTSIRSTWHNRQAYSENDWRRKMVGCLEIFGRSVELYSYFTKLFQSVRHIQGKEIVRGSYYTDSTWHYSAIAKPNMITKTKKLSIFWNYLALICKAEIPYPLYLNCKFLFTISLIQGPVSPIHHELLELAEHQLCPSGHPCG